MGLPPPPAVQLSGGGVHLSAFALASLPDRDRHAIRSDCIAVIFQENLTSLNSLISIGFQLTYAIRARLGVSRIMVNIRAIDA